MTRNLIDGSSVEELENPVTLSVYTKCPEKYKLVDLETGEEYIGQSGEKYHWKRISK